MGTLMRTPDTTGAPRTLVLPAHTGAAPEPEHRPQNSNNGSTHLAAVHSEATNYPRVTAGNGSDGSATHEADVALAQCAQLQLALDKLQGELQQHQDAAHAQGHASGLAEGLAEGRAEAQAEAVNQARLMNTVLQQIEQSRTEVLGAAENEIAEAVFAALGKILGKNMATRRGAAAAVKQVCKQITKRQDLIVRVAPSDLELLIADSALMAEFDGKTRFTADANVELGGCLVESGGGTLDGRIETQLNKLHQVLVRARQKREGNGKTDQSSTPGATP